MLLLLLPLPPRLFLLRRRLRLRCHFFRRRLLLLLLLARFRNRFQERAEVIERRGARRLEDLGERKGGAAAAADVGCSGVDVVSVASAAAAGHRRREVGIENASSSLCCSSVSRVFAGH